MLKTARGTQALIDLEEMSPDVLLEHVGDSPVPLWPQVRSLVAVALNELDYDIATVHASTTPRSNAWLGLAKAFVPSRWDASLARGRSSLCFVTGGTTAHTVDGHQRNWLVGDFIERHLGISSVLQWAPLPSPYGEPSFARTWSLDRVKTRSAGYARLARRDPEPEVRLLVAEFLKRLDVPLPEEKAAGIAAAATYHERTRPHIERALLRALDRLSPAIVVMEDASYGTWGSAIAGMKDRGILVVEPQHGWIGPTHASYNFGAAMHGEVLRRTLPDELLTFGTYWGQGLRFPGQITPIGKPHIEKAATEVSVPFAERSDVLVVSSTSDPEEMSQFVLSLRDKLDASWTVAFRPHPSERRVLSERYPELVGAAGVRIDTGGDVYESLGTAAVVIGVASTVLFEARAFGCHVFVRDSPMLDYYVGDRFGPPIASDSDLATIARQINSHEFEDVAGDDGASELWAPAASERFQAWAASALAAR